MIYYSKDDLDRMIRYLLLFVIIFTKNLHEKRKNYSFSQNVKNNRC